MISRRLKILMVRRNIKMVTLAERLNTSVANVSNKFKRNNFRLSEIEEICNILDCEVIITFKLNDTDEEY